MMSTLGSFTSSSYEPYAEAEEGHLHVSRNCLAREEEDEEAAAVTVCFISETDRVEGSIMRSLANSKTVEGRLDMSQ